jgi:hypothetical protein
MPPMVGRVVHNLSASLWAIVRQGIKFVATHPESLSGFPSANLLLGSQSPGFEFPRYRAAVLDRDAILSDRSESKRHD